MIKTAIYHWAEAGFVDKIMNQKSAAIERSRTPKLRTILYMELETWSAMWARVLGNEEHSIVFILLTDSVRVYDTSAY